MHSRLSEIKIYWNFICLHFLLKKDVKGRNFREMESIGHVKKKWRFFIDFKSILIPSAD